LITGTNRNKTLEEIVSKEDFISEAGWVYVHVVGVEAIQAALSKLPQNEFITWLAVMREQTEQTDIKIQLPPKQTTDTIKEYARQYGLDFQIQSP
jgi:orotidine-5'-phosphate decarboxylase